jgi:carboxylesterase
MPQILATAEPFFLPGETGRAGCLLIHGFTGTPKEMRWMGEYLQQRGLTCLGVRLAGHATRPQDMIRSRYTDWIASVEDGYHLLRGALGGESQRETPPLFLVGLSMGGVLSLLMSTRLPVAGVVAISTPYALPSDPPLWLVKGLSWFVPALKKSKGPPGTGWFDQQAWREHVSYPKNPTRSIAELLPLLAEMRAALPQVRVPVLLIHSRDDRYVLPENMDRIYAALGASTKERLWVTGSGHIVTREPPRQQVFEAAFQFIRRIEVGE